MQLAIAELDAKTQLWQGQVNAAGKAAGSLIGNLVVHGFGQVLGAGSS